MIQQIEI